MSTTSWPSMANPAAAAGLVAGALSPGGSGEAGAARLGPRPSAWLGLLPSPPGRRPELGGVTALVLVTLLAALAAPHARVVRGKLAGIGGLPTISLPKPKPPASPPATRAPRG
jgi:hypothetical protein